MGQGRSLVAESGSVGIPEQGYIQNDGTVSNLYCHKILCSIFTKRDSVLLGPDKPQRKKRPQV